jgi:hypothetical protein
MQAEIAELKREVEALKEWKTEIEKYGPSLKKLLQAIDNPEIIDALARRM